MAAALLLLHTRAHSVNVNFQLPLWQAKVTLKSYCPSSHLLIQNLRMTIHPLPCKNQPLRDKPSGGSIHSSVSFSLVTIHPQLCCSGVGAASCACKPIVLHPSHWAASPAEGTPYPSSAIQTLPLLLQGIPSRSPSICPVSHKQEQTQGLGLVFLKVRCFLGTRD